MNGEKGMKGGMGDPGIPGDPGGPGISGGASVYINWGSTMCPDSSDLVYEGIAVSPAFNNAGGGAQYLCLPDSPDVGGLPIISVTTPSSTLVGVHYETFADPPEFPFGDVDFQEPLHNNDGRRVVCSVCLTSNSVVVMTPNNMMCPEDSGPVSWDLEYSGFLMTARDFIYYDPQGVLQGPVFAPGNDENPPHFRTEYVCVNALPDPAPNPDPGPTTEANMAHVRVYCGTAFGFENECDSYQENVLEENCPIPCPLCIMGPLLCSVCSASM